MEVGDLEPGEEAEDFDYGFCSVLGKRAEGSFQENDLRGSQVELWVDTVLSSSSGEGTKYSALRSLLQSRISPPSALTTPPVHQTQVCLEQSTDYHAFRSILLNVSKACVSIEMSNQLLSC